MECINIQQYAKQECEDINYLEEQYKTVGGIDEAGRGALAGPVVAACVVFSKGLYLPGIKDSKMLTQKRRESAYADIFKNAVSISFGIVHNDTIDKINILNATRQAMIQTVDRCVVKPDMLLIDAVELKELSISHKSIIRGDQRIHCIAAASIIAKVLRDYLMYLLHKQYPEYGFDKHKGYGTPEHIKNIEKYGLSPVHRKTFCLKLGRSSP